MKYVQNEMNMHVGKYGSSHIASQSIKFVVSKMSKMKKENKCRLVISLIEDLIGILVVIIQTIEVVLVNIEITGLDIKL